MAAGTLQNQRGAPTQVRSTPVWYILGRWYLRSREARMSPSPACSPDSDSSESVMGPKAPAGPPVLGWSFPEQALGGGEVCVWGWEVCGSDLGCTQPCSENHLSAEDSGQCFVFCGGCRIFYSHPGASSFCPQEPFPLSFSTLPSPHPWPLSEALSRWLCYGPL